MNRFEAFCFPVQFKPIGKATRKFVCNATDDALFDPFVSEMRTAPPSLKYMAVYLLMENVCEVALSQRADSTTILKCSPCTRLFGLQTITAARCSNKSI
jgi:hypothetical protein